MTNIFPYCSTTRHIFYFPLGSFSDYSFWLMHIDAVRVESGADHEGDDLFHCAVLVISVVRVYSVL